MTKLVKILAIVAGSVLLLGVVGGFWVGISAHNKADTIAEMKADKTDVEVVAGAVNVLKGQVTALRTDTDANKAALTALRTDTDANKAALANKADSSALDTLRAAVNAKADSSALDTLKVDVAKEIKAKASKFALKALDKRVKTLECQSQEGGCDSGDGDAVEIRVK